MVDGLRIVVAPLLFVGWTCNTIGASIKSIRSVDDDGNPLARAEQLEALEAQATVRTTSVDAAATRLLVVTMNPCQFAFSVAVSA